VTARAVAEIVVPARHGRASIVNKGQTFRLHQIEGGQVGVRAFLNAGDPRKPSMPDRLGRSTSF
jgi:uncharacterized protein YcgI (DUF1989 family)